MGWGASLSGPSEEWKERLLCRGQVISRASKALTHTEDPPDKEAHECLLVTELHRDLFLLTSDTPPLSFSLRQPSQCFRIDSCSPCRHLLSPIVEEQAGSLLLGRQAQTALIILTDGWSTIVL